MIKFYKKDWVVCKEKSETITVYALEIEAECFQKFSFDFTKSETKRKDGVYCVIFSHEKSPVTLTVYKYNIVIGNKKEMMDIRIPTHESFFRQARKAPKENRVHDIMVAKYF